MKELKKIKYWLFDLDNTLYSGDTKVFDQVDQKMSFFISKKLKVSVEEAKKIQKNYFHEYNTTLNGMIKNHKIDAEEFLEFVHDVDFDDLNKDNELKKLLSKINGQKSIYTNASFNHAKKILNAMGIFDEFEIIFDIKDSNYIAKPDYNSYLMMKEKLGLNDKNITRSIFFEDTAKNLKPASKLGMSTVWIENDFNREEAKILNEYINFSGSDIKSILNNMLNS